MARDNAITLPQNWSKQQVKTYAEGTRGRNLNKDSDDIEKMDSLQWLRPVKQGKTTCTIVERSLSG